MFDLLHPNFAGILTFENPKRERLFLVRNIRKSLRQAQIAILVGLAMYSSFAFLDLNLDPKSFVYSASLRLVFAPLCIALCLYLTQRIKSKLELWSMLVLILTQVGHLFLIVVGNFPQFYLPIITSIVFVFALTFSNIRLRFSLIYLFSSFVITLLFYIFVVKPDSKHFIFGLFIMVSFGVISVLAGYSREYYVRKDFLQSDALAREKIKSDSLLLNILPQQIAQELKTQGTTKPVSYEGVSVLFADFVGFTKQTTGVGAEPIITTLDRYFSYFDYITKKYKLEKIKTIGDAYMLAGGLDSSIKTHAVDCILASFDFLDFVIRDAKDNNNSLAFDLRIGIHTGPVVAGVIGSLKFAYDIFGSTVNVASRMEKYSIGNKINISRNTYELVKDFFDCESRGVVEVKNGEKYEMFFVRSLKPELCLDIEGNIPNTDFVKLYNKLAN